MLHSGDIYEGLARTARHQELRRLAGAVHTLLFRYGTARAIPDSRSVAGFEIANDINLTKTNRAA